MISKERLTRLTRDLLKINSENPHGNEKEIASFVACYLKKIGLKSRVRAFCKDRDNVSAIWAGKRRGGALLITPHLDTVPAGSGWAHGPFSGDIRRGRIYGRGSSDCKGNLAVALEALTSLTQDGFVPEHDVIFLATADEEAGSSKGLIPFLEKDIVKPDFALILDSDDCNIIVAQKGLIHFKVKVKGRKAHGAYPHRGINAINHACRLIEILKNLKFNFKCHPLLRPPTVNIGTIRGGDKVNIVADWCEFEADLRFLPGMDSKKIFRQIKRGFNQARTEYEIIVSDIQQPYEISTRHPLVSGLKKAAFGIAKDSVVKGSEGATVITFFKKKNIPAVATGYGASGCAHMTDEYARVDDLYRGALVLERFIRIFDRRYFKSS